MIGLPDKYLHIFWIFFWKLLCNTITHIHLIPLVRNIWMLLHRSPLSTPIHTMIHYTLLGTLNLFIDIFNWNWNNNKSLLLLLLQLLLMCRHRKDLCCCFKAVTLASSSDFSALKIDVCQIEFATSSKEQSEYM